jgi:itaconyl-CoA hydratase
MNFDTLTGNKNYFEDFSVGLRMRHFRGLTIGEVENNFISKQVLNTAQTHWNEEYLKGSQYGDGRVVFGMVTASAVVGMTLQDTAENAVAEIGLHNVQLRTMVRHGDTLTAYTEILSVEDSPERDDAGLVRFKHWGRNQRGEIVCVLERTVLIKRRPTT